MVSLSFTSQLIPVIISTFVFVCKLFSILSCDKYKLKTMSVIFGMEIIDHGNTFFTLVSQCYPRNNMQVHEPGE